MPRNHKKLERQILRACQQAIADDRWDVVDHLFHALEALDSEFDGVAVRDACRSILETTKEAPRRH